MKMKTKGFKILSEDWCSPIQDKENKYPLVPNGKLPYTLPEVEVETDTNIDCGKGWNFCASISDACNITTLVGRKGINKVLVCETSKPVYESKTKLRSSELTLVRSVNLKEIHKFHLEHKIDNKLADKELYKWLNVKRNKTDDNKIELALKKTLKARQETSNWVVEKGNYNNYHNYYNYYNNYHNYYNYYNNYNNYDNYYYIAETVISAIHHKTEAEFKAIQHLRTAYSYGMRQLRFEEGKLIYFTRDQI